MFLRKLSDSKREKFVELAYKLAYSNREFPEVQQKLLGRYMEECGVRYVPNTSTREELIAWFGQQTDVEKKIVYLEIYMLLISDEKIDADEEKVLSALRSSFAISEEEASQIQEKGMELEKVTESLKEMLGI